MGCSSSKQNEASLVASAPSTCVVVPRPIEDFVDRIFVDLCTNKLLEKQRELFKCGDFLVRPLPVDTASTPKRTEVLTQFIHTIDKNPLQGAHESMTTTECQSASVLCSVAASGTGKTHMVYTLGQSSVYAVLIRVGLQSGDLSAPWSSLSTRISRDMKTRNDLDELDLASVCMSHIRLLILSYLEATVRVITYAQASKMSLDQLPEILLRFHRNGMAENIIDDIYQENMKTYYLQPMPSRDVYRESIKEYREELVRRLRALDLQRPMFICFDEIQVLINRFSTTFFGTEHYKSLRDGIEEDGREGRKRRDLFYATFYIMMEIVLTEKWTVFMTGTYFSLNLADASSSGFSPARGGKISKVSPNGSLTFLDMKVILQHYWKIPDDVVEHEKVRALMEGFRGRPLLFAEGVFKTLCDATIFPSQEFGPFASVTVESMVRLLEEGQRKLRFHFSGMMGRLFSSNRVIPGVPASTTKGLIGVLVNHFLFQHELNLKRVKDQAIASGLLGFREAENGELDVADEPLVRQAIVTFIYDCLKEDYDTNLEIIARDSYDQYNSKGDFAEFLVALDLALRSNVEQPLSLAAYLKHFGIDCPALDVWMISSDILPVAHRENTKATSFFQSFTDDAVVDKVFYNIPQICGCDVALKVTHSSEANSSRLVVFQLKNTEKMSLKELTCTLHPATQYIQNYSRDMLLHCTSPWRVSQMTPSVPHLQDHLNLFSDSETPGWLVSDWIRVGLVAGVVPDGARDLSSCLCDTHQDYLLFGSLNAHFTKAIRASFIKQSTTPIKVDATIEFLKERTVASLLTLRPTSFRFDLVPSNLEKAIKEHRMSSEPTLSKEAILESVENEMKANVLWDLVEEERQQRIAYEDARKQ